MGLSFMLNIIGRISLHRLISLMLHVLMQLHLLVCSELVYEELTASCVKNRLFLPQLMFLWRVVQFQ